MPFVSIISFLLFKSLLYFIVNISQDVYKRQGSNYIKELARYLATNRNYMINADVILIDGDTVEEKNLERQSFTPEDLLMNKAEAMALACLLYTSNNSYQRKNEGISRIYINHSRINGKRFDVDMLSG